MIPGVSTQAVLLELSCLPEGQHIAGVSPARHAFAPRTYGRRPSGKAPEQERFGLQGLRVLMSGFVAADSARSWAWRLASSAEVTRGLSSSRMFAHARSVWQLR